MQTSPNQIRCACTHSIVRSNYARASPIFLSLKKCMNMGGQTTVRVRGGGKEQDGGTLIPSPPPPFSLHPTLPFSLYFPSHKNFDDNFMLPFLKPLAHRHHPSGVFSSASCLIFFLLFQGNRQTLRRQALDYFLPSVVDKSLSSEVQVAD